MFFFSSRRRHTRYWRDWSSDVCSSDLDIVRGSNVNSQDFVIEIGPGVGTLTKELLNVAKKVTAIELDNSLIPILEEELKEYDNFQLINNDALKIDLNEVIEDEESVKLVANLPYYVTTPIIARILKEGYKFKSLTIMIQKEVGDRRSEEHTSELQSRQYLVCRLLLEKKNNTSNHLFFSL